MNPKLRVFLETLAIGCKSADGENTDDWDEGFDAGVNTTINALKELIDRGIITVKVADDIE